MNGTEAAAWAQALAGALTFGAAACAVRAAYNAPKQAARFAEELRSEAAPREDIRRAKLSILSTMMAHRVTIADPASVNAINLIPLVFSNVKSVKEAHASFMSSADERPFSSEKLSERYRRIIERIAQDLGLMETLSLAEINSPYIPKAITDRMLADAHELEQRLQLVPGFTAASGSAPPTPAP